MAGMERLRRIVSLSALAALVALAPTGRHTFLSAAAALRPCRLCDQSSKQQQQRQSRNAMVPSSSRVSSREGTSAAAAFVGLFLAGAACGFRNKRWNGMRAGVVVRKAQMQPNLPDAGIAVLDKVDAKAAMKEQFEKEKWWRVLLHNDDIHTFEYVTNCLVKVVQHLTRRKAYNITWEAHSAGKATCAVVWKAMAEQFCVKLQQDGLTVSIAPDSKFEGNKGGK